MTSNDWKTTFKFGVLFLLLVFALSVVGSILFGWFGGAGILIQKEFGPDAAMAKYSWFIDQSNAIKKADADIVLYQQRYADVETHYVSIYGEDKTKWATSVQVQYNHAISTTYDDMMAIISNRNTLVKEYNAQSKKFNWSPFMTRSDLPPQTFLEYIER